MTIESIERIMSNIITVTLNPALDKTAKVKELVPGGLNRLEDIVTDAGGKGINVSKMISALGGESIASGFIGGDAGEEIEKTLNRIGIKTDFVRVKHPTRTNLKVLSKEHGITEFNEPGGAVSFDEMSALKEKLVYYAKPGVIFAFSGSLPRGADLTTYATLISLVKEKGAAVFLDADGEAFSAAIEAKPDYIKPNKFELMQYFAHKEEQLSMESCDVLCRKLVGKGIKMVVSTMGADGAIFVTANETLIVSGIKIQASSTVGAGDSMVGALLYAFERGMALPEAAALSVAASAGAVATEGTKPPSLEKVNELVKQVKIKRV